MMTLRQSFHLTHLVLSSLPRAEDSYQLHNTERTRFWATGQVLFQLCVCWDQYVNPTATVS